MAIPLPILDDRTYEQLVTEMLELLPRNNREWTNRNPTDPGVMLLELFAYLIEMDIFQLDRITNESYAKFLKLVEVDTSAYSVEPTNEEIRSGVVQALQNLSYLRGVSDNDMSRIIEDVLLPLGIISRIYTFSGKYIKKNFWEPGPDINKRVHAEMEKEGYTLVILSIDNSPFMREQDNPCLTQVAIDRSPGRYTLSDVNLYSVVEALRQRRMLTNRIYVHQARVINLAFYIKIVPEKNADLEELPKKIIDKILDYYCPVWGGEDETGFALGRPFKNSEAISVIEQALGVDYTDEFTAWYEESPGQWEIVPQIYEPRYFEQLWVESAELSTNPSMSLPVNDPPLTGGITIEISRQGN